MDGKVALVGVLTSIAGLLALVYIGNVMEPGVTKINAINDNLIEKNIRISGSISEIIRVSSAYHLTISNGTTKVDVYFSNYIPTKSHNITIIGEKILFYGEIVKKSMATGNAYILVVDDGTGAINVYIPSYAAADLFLMRDAIELIKSDNGLLEIKVYNGDTYKGRIVKQEDIAPSLKESVSGSIKRIGLSGDKVEITIDTEKDSLRISIPKDLARKLGVYKGDHADIIGRVQRYKQDLEIVADNGEDVRVK